MLCPICAKRKPVRFCPAKAEKICAVCCGTEREVTIDCPHDCAYLVAAHRYETEHPRTLPQDTPLLDARIASDVIQANQQVLSALAFQVAKFCSITPAATDADVLAAIQALAESFRTLASGLVFEQIPVAPVQRELYNALSVFFDEVRKQAQNAKANLKDIEVFQVLVFLYRMGLLRSNGRPRSRRFIEFLRGQFPGAQELKHEESRIIIP